MNTRFSGISKSGGRLWACATGDRPCCVKRGPSSSASPYSPEHPRTSTLKEIMKPRRARIRRSSISSGRRRRQRFFRVFAFRGRVASNALPASPLVQAPGRAKAAKGGQSGTMIYSYPFHALPPRHRRDHGLSGREPHAFFRPPLAQRGGQCHRLALDREGLPGAVRRPAHCCLWAARNRKLRHRCGVSGCKMKGFPVGSRWFPRVSGVSIQGSET